MTELSELTAAALALAGRGWRVFPLRPGTKQPAVTDWENRATTDPDRIARCWAQAGWNIGVAVGPSGLLVVDLDRPKPGEAPPPEWALLGITDGADVLAELAARARQPVPATHTVVTPSGGRHLYFTAPTAGAQLRNTAGRLGWRIDTRGHGGYVVGAGSHSPDGPYTIADPREPVPLPGWLHHLLRPKPPTTITAANQAAPARQDRYLRAVLDREAQHVSSALDGQHNAALFSAALTLGRLVAGGELTEPEVRAVLLTASAGHIAGTCKCTDATVRRTITAGLSYAVTRPRRIPAPTAPHPAGGRPTTGSAA